MSFIVRLFHPFCFRRIRKHFALVRLDWVVDRITFIFPNGIRDVYALCVCEKEKEPTYAAGFDFIAVAVPLRIEYYIMSNKCDGKELLSWIRYIEKRPNVRKMVWNYRIRMVWVHMSMNDNSYSFVELR